MTGKHKIPAGVCNAARKALQMHRNGMKGMMETGLKRARQLSRCTYVDDATIRTMRAWFKRHRYTSYPGYKKWIHDGKPMAPSREKGIRAGAYRGAKAWLGWGGDPAAKWVKRVKLTQ